MERKAPIINLAEIPLEAYGKGGHFAAMLGRAGATLGTRQIGCTLVVLESGKRAWPYHLHYAEEELFVVLEGEGTLRYDGEEFPVRTGDMVLTPPGPGTAHQIINTSERELRYLALSGKRMPQGNIGTISMPPPARDVPEECMLWGAVPANLAGLTLVCREPVTSGWETSDDHPITAAGEEIDCLALYDHVEISRDYVFSYRNRNIASIRCGSNRRWAG